MIKIAVCDDEPEQLHQIQAYLAQLQKETNREFDIFYFSDGESLIKDMPRDIQILLLDIQMNKLSGMNAAKLLRKEGLDLNLIFITNNIEYALEGYEVHAYAFLRKPVIYSHLKRYIIELIRKINQNKPYCISLKTSSGTKIINCNKILYFEVYGHTVKAVTSNESIESFISLSELDDKLQSHGFFRCHKSYLVNLIQISHIGTRDLLLKNDFQIPLSKHKKKEMIAAFSKFMGDSL